MPDHGAYYHFQLSLPLAGSQQIVTVKATRGRGPQRCLQSKGQTEFAWCDIALLFRKSSHIGPRFKSRNWSLECVTKSFRVPRREKEGKSGCPLLATRITMRNTSAAPPCLRALTCCLGSLRICELHLLVLSRINILADDMFFFSQINLFYPYQLWNKLAQDRR